MPKLVDKKAHIQFISSVLLLFWAEAVLSKDGSIQLGAISFLLLEGFPREVKNEGLNPLKLSRELHTSAEEL